MHISLRQIKNIFKREISVYFTTPSAYVFIVIFLLLAGFFTFASPPFGDILNSNETSLSNSFFVFHPWLYLVLIPAIGMRLWSEEKKSGTIEFLFTLPVNLIDAVIGKYLAAMIIAIISLIMTLPIALTVNWLGNPDNNIILCGYLASVLLAASYLSLTSLFSAITKNQIISFIISFTVCLFLALIGHPSFTDFFVNWAPVWLTNLLVNLSIFPHFEMLQKGIIDFRDIFYFLSIILFGLFGTYMVLKFRKFSTYFKLILIFIIFVDVNSLLDRIDAFRFDLTKDNLYTLSTGTKNILKNLEQPVTIRYYCSYKDNRLPIQLRGYADRIDDLLHEYAVLSKGKIRLQKIDPAPDSDYETSAVIDGIQGQMLKDGTRCYFGLAFSCMNKNEVISFLNPFSEKTVEYDITRAVFDVTNFSKVEVGVLSSLPVMGGFSGVIPLKTSKNLPWIFIQELQKVFNIVTVDQDAETISDDIDLLMIIHPKHLSASTLLAIDQFLLRGGKVLAFLDPFCVADSVVSTNKYLSNSQPEPTSSNMEDLLTAWGVEFSKANQVLISPQNAYKASTAMEKEHPAVLDITNKYLNTKSILTANLNMLDIVFSGAFKLKKMKNIETEVLAWSDPDSELFDDFSMNLPVDYIMKNFKPDNKVNNIIVKLSGSFDTAFPDALKNKNVRVHDEKILSHSSKNSSVILVGDVDMLFNPFCVAKKQVYNKTVVDTINSNIDFVLNAVDQMTGSQNIIEIRTRGTKKRGFIKFDQLINKARKKYRKQILILEKQLQETNKYINSIQNQTSDNKKIKLNDNQLNTLRKQRLHAKETGMKLRELRKLLRDNIDKQKAVLEFINIAVPPLLVILIGLIVSILRIRSFNKED